MSEKWTGPAQNPVIFPQKSTENRPWAGIRPKFGKERKKTMSTFLYSTSRDWENPAKLLARSRLLGFRRTKPRKRGV